MCGDMKNLKAYECMGNIAHLVNTQMLYQAVWIRNVAWDKKTFLTSLFCENCFKIIKTYNPLKSTSLGNEQKLPLSSYTPKIFKFSNLKNKSLKWHM